MGRHHHRADRPGRRLADGDVVPVEGFTPYRHILNGPTVRLPIVPRPEPEPGLVRPFVLVRRRLFGWFS